LVMRKVPAVLGALIAAAPSMGTFHSFMEGESVGIRQLSEIGIPYD